MTSETSDPQTSDLPASDPQATAQPGFDALRRGDYAQAQALLEPLTESGEAGPGIWLGLALARRGLSESASSRAAADRVLDMDPFNLQALCLKGDLCIEAGEKRLAVALYTRALRAAPPRGQLAAPVAAGLRRAQAIVESVHRDFTGRLENMLKGRGFARGKSSRRFSESLDILMGRKQVYNQVPGRYYFPALPQIQFYERESFPWAAELEAHTDEIRGELVQAVESKTGFRPYVSLDNLHLPAPRQSHLLNNPDWSAFFLVKDGEIQEDNAARCPKTMALLETVPLPKIDNTTPSVLFSLLKPGTHVPPHHGMINTRLICHLPLIAPEGCALRVGNETRGWKEGQLLIFDDTIEHESWNQAAKPRYVLLFDIWRPELSGEERALVTAMFEEMQQLEDPGGADVP